MPGGGPVRGHTPNSRSSWKVSVPRDRSGGQELASRPGRRVPPRAMTATPGAFAHHPALLRYLHYQIQALRCTGKQSSKTWTVVLLRRWFDERTISPRRGNGPLTPNPRKVMVVDGVGRRYAPSSEGLPALAARIPTRPLTTPLGWEGLTRPFWPSSSRPT